MMKKVILCLLFSLQAYDGVCQNRVSGLGVFKIGQRFLEFKQTLQTQSIPIISGSDITSFDLDNLKSTTSLSEFKLKLKPGVIEIELDTNNLSDNYNEELYESSVRIFELNRIEISGIKIENIKFYFYNDSLYKLECLPSMELIDALTLKYGRPTIKLIEENVFCKYRLTGNVEKLKIEKFFSSWPSASGLSTVEVTWNAFDENCKERNFTELCIKNDLKDILVKRHYKKKKQELLEREKIKMKEKYSGV